MNLDTLGSRTIAVALLLVGLSFCGELSRAEAQTMVPPGNTGTQTWTAAGSPYVLTGDIIVQAGAVLTLQPGVRVEVRTGDALGSGLDTSRTEITVRGTLVANGSAALPIAIAGSSSSSTAWYGLVLEAGATSATLSHVSFQNARYCVHSQLPGSSLNLSQATFSTCSTGLRVSAGTPTLSDLTVSTTSAPVVVDGSGGPTFERLHVTGSAGNTSVNVSGSGTTTVRNATIVGGSDCIYTTASLSVFSSIITSCSDDGIDRDAGTVSVSFSNVWGHLGSDFEGTISQSNNFSANPLYVSGANHRLTSNSPSRFTGMGGVDMGALPYVSDATPGLYGTLWVNTVVAAGTTSVAGDLTIPTGVTLTIAPGATLSFATSDIMQAYQDVSRAELRVFGVVNAVGTAGSPITFTSSGGSSTSWYGIDFQGGGGSILDNVILERARYTVHHRSSAGQTIRRAIVRNASTGLRFSTTPSTVDAITISATSAPFVVDGTAAVTLTNSVITGSAGNTSAIFSGSGASVLDHVTIVGGADCVYTTASLSVRSSVVVSCSDDGVDRDAGTVSVSDSLVWGHLGSPYEGTISQTNNISANPLFVGGSNYRLTSNSPARFSGAGGTDIGALPYTGDATPGLYGTLWVDTNVAAGTTTVAGDLTVAPGRTLTLAPGATLSFATSDIMQAYQDVSRAELRVLGTLIARGSAALPITFTSTGGSSTSWYGVDLQGASTGSAFDYAILERARYAIHHRSSGSATIQRTVVRSASTGLRFSTTPGVVDAITVSSTSAPLVIDGSAGPTLTNAVLIGSAGNTTASFSGSGSSTLVNATIVGGSDCVYTTASLAVRSSIIVSCSDDGVDRDAGTVSVTYSDVWGHLGSPYEGTITQSNNISANPLFVGGSDYHLTGSSLCIDSASPTGAPAADRDGVARPLDGDGLGGPAHDMGAYEFVMMLFCGDGVITAGETCDDGALNGMYGQCNATCTGLGPRCGDSITNGPETCDDGNGSNTDACLNTCRLASCGDSFVRAGVEECDDGNMSSTDACIMCTTASCGDGFVRAGVEQCDDGNMSSTDACVMCSNAFCGDGFVRAGVESCDDGNTSNLDACLNTCVAASCGDGFVGPGEDCDDGNTMDGDGCSSTCRSASCGNGVTDAGEECDDANMVNDDGCSNSCRLPACGDGIRQSGEECDDGNMVNDDMCSNMCRNARCGDSIVQAGEECDDGNTIATDACTAMCRMARCGDGVVQSGVEACDDGNTSDTDACVGSCTVAMCGDGFIRAGVEACDDGNTIDGDGCSAECALMSCGDGTVQAGEECDDGNASNFDECLNTCILPSCGDGFRRTGVEACDDGNPDDTDDCLSTCRNPSCGDGFVHSGVEACDDGNPEDTDACLTSCELAGCGDGFIQDGVENCDDGNDVPGDGCNASCMLEPGVDGGPGPGSDGGMGGGDGGADRDGGGGDGSVGPGMDGGAGSAGADGGCGCRAAGRERSAPLGGLVLLGLALSFVWRRRRR